MPEIFVTGHQNPDTDSIVSAHVFAWMLEQSEPNTTATPLRLGDPNPQSAWLFETAGECLPALRTDCRPTLAEACAKAPTVSPDSPLSHALRVLRENRSSVVVVQEEDGKIVGIISDRMPRVNYLLSANIEDMLGTLLRWQNVVESLPLKAVNRVPVEREPSGMRFVSGIKPSPNDVLVTGSEPADPTGILQSNPAAIIVVGPDRCPSLEDQDKIPVYSYQGSAFAFCTSLGGCIPCRNAMETEYTTIDSEEILSETRHKIAQAEHGLLVVHSSGQLVGLVTSQQLAEAQRPCVALVDHFEKAQSIKGLQEASIAAIIDHHRIGDIETNEPVDIDCRIWGSTASILFARCRESGLEVSPSKARLLLGALIADTLLLRSPTTREQDRRIAQELASLADVDLNKFGMEVLRRNDQLLSARADDLVSLDCKTFTHGDHRFIAAQIETVDIAALSNERATELDQAIANQLNGKDFAALMITDVIKQSSRLSILSHSDHWLRILTPDTNEPAWMVADFVSRKKQLIPYLLDRLNS
ncbi:MAG: CBS domain-containing protein [Verrucomicrobiota bacterium]